MSSIYELQRGRDKFIYVYISIYSYKINKMIVYMQCIYRRGSGRLVINI